MIAERISKLSSSEEIFNAEAPIYKEALKSAGFSEIFPYADNNKKETERKESHLVQSPFQ